jgi:UDP-N-acetylglucosamine 2-epimerase (non-hydrolysing)
VKKILIVFGTRPEAIKMAPVVRLLHRSKLLQPVVCVTAQHREMLDQVMKVFHLESAFDLDIMTERQSLDEITRRVLDGVTRVIHEVKPVCVLVQGDTTTTFAAALAAFYLNLPVAHIEAGLRTYDKRHPFPEEVNRCLTSRLADFHFAPTAEARANLLREGIENKSILMTGNTVVDALRWVLRSVNGDSKQLSGLESINWRSDFPVLVTAHRRENWNEMERICQAMRGVVRLDPRVHVILPVHPNPALRAVLDNNLKDTARIHLLPALPYTGFLGLMKHCRVVVTDSGGVQEEVASMGKPLVVMRNTTERPEAISPGCGVLAGTQPAMIVRAVAQALAQPNGKHRRNPFGDGHASERIVRCLESKLTSPNSRQPVVLAALSPTS